MMGSVEDIGRAMVMVGILNYNDKEEFRYQRWGTVIRIQ